MNKIDILNNCEKHWNPMAGLFYKIMNKTVEQKSFENYVYDTEGNKFIDFAGSYGVFLAGHNNPQIQQKFIETLGTIGNYRYNNVSNPHKRDFEENLKKILPKSLVKFYYGNSGSEISELALRIAFASDPDRKNIVVAQNSYHGKTLGSLNILGQNNHRTPFEPFNMNVSFATYGNIESFKSVIDSNTLAIFIEPILGGPYLQVPPKGFLKDLRNLCDHHDILLIVDEIQTGLGRCGKTFGFQYDNIVPDMLLLSKGLTGGFIPFSVLCCSKKIIDKVKSSKHFYQGLLKTTGGSPLACNIANSALDYILTPGLLDSANEKGLYILDKFKTLQRAYPHLILEVVGVGLMIGLKLRNPAVENILMMHLSKYKIHAGHSLNEKAKNPVLRFYPSLNIQKLDIDIMLEALQSSLELMSKKSSGYYSRLNILVRNQYKIPKFILNKIAHKNVNK